MSNELKTREKRDLYIPKAIKGKVSITIVGGKVEVTSRQIKASKSTKSAKRVKSTHNVKSLEKDSSHSRT